MPDRDTAVRHDRLKHYLKRLDWALAPLPEADRHDILQETRAHFADRMAAGNPDAAFAEIVARFGPPEDYAQQFLDNYQITAAVADGSGSAMLPQALRVAGRGATALLGSAFFLLLYGVALGLVLLAVLKLVAPTHVGLWYAPEQGVAGLGYVDAATAAASVELLGYWILPVNIIGALLLYRGATGGLRRFLRSFIQTD